MGLYAVLCALPQELGGLAERAGHRERALGLEVLDVPLGRDRVRACVAGVGKVRAAHGAAVLLAPGGVDALFVVGTCGALSPGLAVGDLVHCRQAAQVDFALREDREHDASAALRDAWQQVAPGRDGWFLTADRPVLSWWRRRRLAQAYLRPGAGRGTAVADMETAAAAAVCHRAGVPWAGLRAVTDAADPWSGLSFQRNLPIQGPRAADTLPGLLRALAHPPNPS